MIRLTTSEEAGEVGRQGRILVLRLSDPGKDSLSPYRRPVSDHYAWSTAYHVMATSFPYRPEAGRVGRGKRADLRPSLLILRHPFANKWAILRH